MTLVTAVLRPDADTSAVGLTMTWTNYNLGPPHYLSLANTPVNDARSISTFDGATEDNFTLSDPPTPFNVATRMRVRLRALQVFMFGAPASHIQVKVFTGTTQIYNAATDESFIAAPTELDFGWINLSPQLTLAESLDLNFQLLESSGNIFGSFFTKIGEAYIDLRYDDEPPAVNPRIISVTSCAISGAATSAPQAAGATSGIAAASATSPAPTANPESGVTSPTPNSGVIDPGPSEC